MVKYRHFSRIVSARAQRTPILRALLLGGFLLGSLLAGGLFPGSAQAETYRLGPADRLQIRAVAWSDAEQRFEIWDVVSGDYGVQPDGTLAIPLAGAIPAAGLTTEELAARMAETLQERGGLTQPPTIAIEISAYRPFYILGDVARPGAYPMRPGLTVLQAVALAGGGTSSAAATANGGDIRRNFRDAGNLRELLNQIARAQVREARLEAEVAKAESITFPETLRHTEGSAALEQILLEEQAIFEARRDALSRELVALRDLKDLLNVEIAGLERKLGGQAEQIRMSRENIANIATLAERGVVRGQQLSQAQRELIDLEAKETDLQNNIYRARQRIAENDREIIELSLRRQTEATMELQRVRAQLEDMTTRRAVLEQLVLTNGLEDSEVAELASFVTTYEVVRAGSDQGQPLGPAGALGPGDVLTVTTRLAEGSELMQ